MKKRVLLLSVLMTLGLVAFLSSCKKDKTCSCTEYYPNGGSASDTFYPDDYGVGSCAALEDYFIMNMSGQGYSYSCK